MSLSKPYHRYNLRYYIIILHLEGIFPSDYRARTMSETGFLAFGIITIVLSVILVLGSLILPASFDLAFYLELYGPYGLFLWIFGNRTIWQLQMEAVNLEDENIAFSLKKLVQEESEIVAVAASIIAQVAITALSLDNLSQAHWIARSFFILSLVSAVIAVYAASTEYRIFCRCISAEDIRVWIKGSPSSNEFEIGGKRMFAAPIASVITVSAPFALLVVALNSFLIGFGLWLGFVWTKSLDPNSTPEDSRAVFIIYIIGLGTCYLVYTASSRSAGQQKPLIEWLLDLKSRVEWASSERNRRNEEYPQGYPAHEPVITTASQPESSHEELSDALLRTAKLGRELAESQEFIARLYERLTQE
ncbi:hypothetical protein F4679DRAFT_556740 [Xylaria curta]|nr:hypothetical protein F4679DRAFT_556740 [Xylaria curta]